ncbi:hypothetical protein D3C73_441280 [compost metagenome]
MLAGIDLLLGEIFARIDLRQATILVVILRLFVFVATIHVGAQEAVETDDRADGAKAGFVRAIGGEDFDRRAFHLGGRHLAGDAALPDQFVKTRLIGIEEFPHLIRRAVEVGRADCFVRFLGVLCLGGIETRLFRQIAVAELIDDGRAGCIDRFGRHLHAVGTHIGNETDRLAADIDAFIKLLRHLHGTRCVEADIRRSCLLQARSGERRAGIALDRLRLDAVDHKACAFEQGLQPVGIIARLDCARCQALAIGRHKLGLELIAARCLQESREVPVFFRNETLDLVFAIADKAQRHRLHTAGRASARQLAPQDRRQVEADEIVECTAGQIGVDQRHVDIARSGHRIEHGLFGDGVEDDTLYRLVAEHLLLLQEIENVPGNGFTFAIRVGRKKQAVGAFYGIGDVLHAFLRRAVDLPGHFEILIGKHGAVFRGKIADVAKGCENLITRAQILIDRLGFGGRFYNDNIHFRFSVIEQGPAPHSVQAEICFPTWRAFVPRSRA